MKRDYKSAVKSAVNGIYSNSFEDMEQSLWDVLEYLEPDMAELMQDDPEAAHCKVNNIDVEEDEEEEMREFDIDSFEED